MKSRGQREAEPRAANCVELSRAEPEHFASVWLFCIWGSTAGEIEEMMLRKGKPGILEKPSPLEVVHSSGLASTRTPSHDLSCLLKIFLMVACILKPNSRWNLEFTAQKLILNCLLQEH